MRTLSAAFLALAILLAACGRDDPQALLASAKQYMAKRDFAASVIQLKNALQKDPQHAEARYLLGLASLEAGDLVTAEVELAKARELGYRGEELDVALARTLLAKGQPEKLLAQFGTAKLSSPKLQAELRSAVGAALLTQNRPSDAKTAFQEAVALDSSNVAANVGLARLAAAERDFGGAMKRVDAALAIMPASAQALIFKADLFAAQGENEAAEKAYREAVAATGGVPARLALVVHLLRNRSLDKAATEVAALEGVAPKDLRTYYAKAMVLGERRDYAGARSAIQQVLKVAPDHVPSVMIAGLAALQLRNYAEAESHFRKAVQLAPEATGAKRLLAMTHLRMGQTTLALAEAKELVGVAVNDPEAAALAGEAYLAAGDVASAARQYEKAKSLLPDNAIVQTRLALVRLAAGEGERGLKELESTAATQSQDYQADLALVSTYLRERQADKALKALQGLEKKQPSNPLTHNLRGLALLFKRDYAGARASFERALALNPVYIPAVTNLAQLDLRDKQPETAKKRYAAVLQKEPNNEEALSGLAVLMRITGAPKEEVEKLLAKAVAGNPSSPAARSALVNFHLRNRDTAKALAAAQEAQVVLPNNATVTELLGSTQLAAGETNQAIATFTRLAQMAPNSPQPLLQLARAHLAAKQPDEAIKSLRGALALRPELGVVERDITAIYVATGRFDEALAEARTLKKEQPENPLGYALEGEIYIAQKKLDVAERSYRGALKKFDLPALAIRAHTVMNATGKRDEADALAQSWIVAHPKDVAVLIYLGQRDLTEKRYASAEKRYQSALERAPDNPVVLNNLAWVANELKHAKALEYAERANELAPEHPEIMDTLGSILSERGENERGLQLLGRAAEMAPNAAQIRLNFAKALVKAGRKDAARKELEVLTKLDSKLPVQQEAAALLAAL